MLASKNVQQQGSNNFWQYVRRTKDDPLTIDTDRAVEYVRRHSSKEIFRLFLMGVDVALRRTRKKDKEVFGITADFQLDDHKQLHDRPELHRVMMGMTLTRLEPVKKMMGGDDLNRKYYELILLVSDEGLVVDVDFTRLLNQINQEAPWRTDAH
jgi:hypothetical protein